MTMKIHEHTSSTRTRRGGSCLKEIYIYIRPFFIYRTCMRRAPAKPVRACILRKWCPVSHVTFEAPLRTSHFSLRSSHSTLHASHFALHTSHCTLHTPHFTLHTPHFTLHTALFALHTSLHTALLRLHTSHSTLLTSHCFLHTPHFLAIFMSSERSLTFLISPKLISAHLGSSARQKA